MEIDLNKRALNFRSKQSFVGHIPKDWIVIELASISTEIGDGIHATPIYVSSSEYHFINGNNLFNGKIIITGETKCVSKQEYLSLKINLADSTILMSINGTIGNLAFYNQENIVLGKSASYINLNKGIDKYYIYYILQYKSTQNYYESELTGTTIRNLSLRSIRETPIPIPPTKAEQTAIATALSDADALIQSLEKLIAKKRLIKQGAMQKLLKPKGGWVVKKLGDCFKLSAGKSKSGYIDKSGLFIIMDMGSVSTEGKIIPNKRSNKMQDILDYGDLIMPKDDIGGGNIIGKVAFIDRRNKYILGDHVYRLRKCDENVNPLFFHYLINSIYVNYYLKKKVSGSAQLGIGRRSVEEQEVIIPKLINEQSNIAVILSDMDAEIDILKSKLEKYKQIKQGMMQNLLTGKIRLV
jgi:type I restriction enzyme, S subunit